MGYIGKGINLPDFSGLKSVRKVDLLMINENAALSPYGAFMIKLTNATGGATIKGSVVSCSDATDNAFKLQANEFDSIGIVYESGIADGQEAWIIVSGIAEVLWKDGETSTREYVAIAADTDGRALNVAVPSSNPVVAEHFKEIGHVLESKGAGTDVLVKCVIHFN